MFLSYGPEPRCQEEIPVLVTFATRMHTLIDYFAVNSGAAGSGRIARASLP
jgi:hypothetical protein